MTDLEDFLAHYGVKGMKWGRRDVQNHQYTDSQVKRDQQVYGTRGVKRINKQLNDGGKISVARGNEKTRRDRVMGKNKYVRQGGKVAGAAGGIVAVNAGAYGVYRAAQTRVGKSLMDRYLGGVGGSQSVQAVMNNPALRVAASVGAAKVGEMLSGDIAVDLNMRFHGYDPSRR